MYPKKIMLFIDVKLMFLDGAHINHVMLRLLVKKNAGNT
jgi:hypothetical protein